MLYRHTGSSVECLAVYLVGVCPVLVFGSVRGVGEGFVASFVLADVWFLAGVRAQMGFQVL